MSIELTKQVREVAAGIDKLGLVLADMTRRIEALEARPTTAMPPKEDEREPVPIPPYPKALRDIGLNPPLPKEG